jgi:hypothetical protein
MEGSKVKVDQAGNGVKKRVDLSKLIAELTEEVERERDLDFEMPVREPIRIQTIADDPPPALRHLRETHDEFYARMRATFDSIRRRR